VRKPTAPEPIPIANVDVIETDGKTSLAEDEDLNSEPNPEAKKESIADAIDTGSTSNPIPGMLLFNIYSIYYH